MDSLMNLPDLQVDKITEAEALLLRKLSVSNVEIDLSETRYGISVDTSGRDSDKFLGLQFTLNGYDFEVRLPRGLVKRLLGSVEGIEEWSEDLLFVRWQFLLEGLLFECNEKGVDINLKAVGLLGDSCFFNDNSSLPFSLFNLDSTYNCSFTATNPLCVLIAELLDGCEQKSTDNTKSIEIVGKVVAGFTDLPLSVIKSLQLNDLVLMDSTSILEDGLYIKLAGRHLNAQFLNSGMLSVLSIGAFSCKKETDIEELTMELEDVEMKLEFVCGRKQLALSEIQKIESGYVFELDTPINSLVSIEVNGSSIGKGRIVQVGDQLGVQIVSMTNSSITGVESIQSNPTEEVA